MQTPCRKRVDQYRTVVYDRADRVGEEVDGSDNGQRQNPDAGRHRHGHIRCSIADRREGVTDRSVAVGTENRQGEDRGEPVEPSRRVEQLTDRLAEYPLLYTQQ